MTCSLHTKNKLGDVDIDFCQLFQKAFKAFNGIVDFEGFPNMFSFVVSDSSNVSFLGNVNSNNVHKS